MYEPVFRAKLTIVIVLAHRGLRRHGPENSLPGMRGVALAAASGLPLGVELDVRRTADDVLIVAHDHATWREPVSNSSLTWADYWYENALQLLGEHCPARLDDVLEVLGGVVPLIDVDVKERGYTKAVLDATVSIQPERLMISSHVPEVIREARQWAREGVRTGMSVGEYSFFDADRLMWLLEDVQADFLFLEQGHVNPAMVKRLHDAGKQVGVYTVNEQVRLHELIEMGVDFPCTDHPEMAIKELITPEEVSAS